MSAGEISLLALCAGVLCAGALISSLWLYFAPLELSGELRRERGTGLAGELRLKLGILAVEAAPAGQGVWQLRLRAGALGLARWKTSPRAAAPESEEEKPEEEKPESRRSGRSLAWARRHWDLPELLRFLFDHRHLLAIGPMDGRVEFGFEDPALTGEVFGYACAVRQLSPALAGVELEPLWCFENDCWGRLRGRIRARLVALLTALAFHLATHYERDRVASAAGPGLGGGAAAT